MNLENMPLISVIIPIYKVERYLKKCVDSVLNQDYKNLEIILVDDGSPDNCPQICDSYASQDSRIVVIHKKNGGLSDARNAGLETAHGEYVLFVDSDDWIHENCIRLLHEYCNKYDADIAIGNYKTFGENDEMIEQKKIKVDDYEILSAVEACKRNCFEVVFVTSWGKLIKRKLISNNLFPKGKIHEDEFSTYRLLFKSDKIVYTSNQIYYYLLRSTSIMGEKKIFYHKDAIIAYIEKIKFYEKFEKKLVNLAIKKLMIYCLMCACQKQKNNLFRIRKIYLACLRRYKKESNSKLEIFKYKIAIYCPILWKINSKVKSNFFHLFS